MKNSNLATLFILLLILLINSTYLSAEQELAEKELRVGVIFGLTGAASRWSQFQQMGIELAREEYTNKNIKIFYEDSKIQYKA